MRTKRSVIVLTIMESDDDQGVNPQPIVCEDMYVDIVLMGFRQAFHKVEARVVSMDDPDWRAKVAEGE